MHLRVSLKNVMKRKPKFSLFGWRITNILRGPLDVHEIHLTFPRLYAESANALQSQHGFQSSPPPPVGLRKLAKTFSYQDQDIYVRYTEVVVNIWNQALLVFNPSKLIFSPHLQLNPPDFPPSTCRYFIGNKKVPPD